MHQLVDVPVDDHVDGVGPAGGQGPAEQGGHHQPDRGQTPLGHDHGGQGGDQQQLDDARLGQGHVGADPGAERRDGWGRATAGSAIGRNNSANAPIRDPGGDGAAGGRPGPGRYHTETVSSLRIGPRPFLLLCRITLATVVLNVVTGAAVRLSDSGLGCPDWPTCSQHHLTPPLRLHPVIEFGNRLVVTLLVVACAVTVVASFLRRPARSDLRWLSGGLIVGVIGEAVLGAFVVYTKLNAYVVMTHFMVGMALLAVAVILTLGPGTGPGRGTWRWRRARPWLTRAWSALIVVVLAAGAATTGAGPHAGGKGAKRIPIGLEDMTRIHAEIVLAAGVVLLVLLWVLWRTNAPARVQDAGPGPAWPSWSSRASSGTPSSSPTCRPSWSGSTSSGRRWCGPRPSGSTTGCPTTGPKRSSPPGADGAVDGVGTCRPVGAPVAGGRRRRRAGAGVSQAVAGAGPRCCPRPARSRRSRSRPSARPRRGAGAPTGRGWSSSGTTRST